MTTLNESLRKFESRVYLRRHVFAGCFDNRNRRCGWERSKAPNRSSKKELMSSLIGTARAVMARMGAVIPHKVGYSRPLTLPIPSGGKRIPG